MTSSLIVSTSRVLVVVGLKSSMETEGEKSKSYSKTLLFDKQLKAFWSLPADDFGPMAMSWDAKTLIHWDAESHAIREFSIDLPAEHLVAPGDRLAQPRDNPLR